MRKFTYSKELFFKIVDINVAKEKRKQTIHSQALNLEIKSKIENIGISLPNILVNETQNLLNFNSRVWNSHNLISKQSNVR